MLGALIRSVVMCVPDQVCSRFTRF